MALIKCPDCGKMVSDRAQNCPDCGFPIQEEVQRLNDITNIESNDVSGGYNNLTEKEVAKKLCEAICKKQFADINVFQSILKNKFAEGYYAKIVEDSRDFSDDETEKNQYIVKNIELILDYLDYPLDAMGIRNWFVNKEDRKGKGFFQSDADSFDDFSKYYINCDACEVIDLRDIMSIIIRSSRFTTRCVISSKSRYAVILTKNANDYNKLVELSKKFIDAYDRDVTVVSSGDLADSINSGDTVKLFEETYERTIIDYVEMEKQMLRAVAQQLKFTSNVKQPITSVGTKTVAGALLAGPAGALVGYAVGKDRSAKFERSRQYNEEIRREQEEGRKTLNNLKYGDKPTKNIMLTRSYLGIMTFAGTLPFYVDSYYRGQEGWKVTICGLVNAEEDRCNEFALEKIPSNMKTQIETRGQLARLYFEKGIVFPKTSFVKKNIGKLLQNPDVNALASEELKYIENIDLNDCSEDWCHEEIKYIRDIKDSVSVDSGLSEKCSKLIVKIGNNIEKKTEEKKNQELESKYQSIVKESVSADEWKMKELVNRIVELGNYKDSLDLKKSFKDKIEEFEQERKLREELYKEKKKRTNKMWYIGTAVTFLAVAIVYVCIKFIPQIKTYNVANNYMLDGKYEEAIEEFGLIKNYKDSKSQIEICKEKIQEREYKAANEFMNNGQYQEAVDTFNSIRNYKDSNGLCVKANLEVLKNASIGDTVTFGDYKGNDEWTVLEKEDDKLFIISKHLIEAKPYVEVESVWEDRSSIWEESTLREWLNSEYLNTAFNSSELPLIQTTIVQNNNSDKYKTYGGVATSDKVFLLSIEEAYSYFSSDDERKATLDNETLSGWWLRSPGGSDRKSASVNSDGIINELGQDVSVDTIGVRPAMWVGIDGKSESVNMDQRLSERKSQALKEDVNLTELDQISAEEVTDEYLYSEAREWMKKGFINKASAYLELLESEYEDSNNMIEICEKYKQFCGKWNDNVFNIDIYCKIDLDTNENTFLVRLPVATESGLVSIHAKEISDKELVANDSVEILSNGISEDLTVYFEFLMDNEMKADYTIGTAGYTYALSDKRGKLNKVEDY